MASLKKEIEIKPITPVVVEAWKCPATGEVFTNLEKFNKHAKKVEARELEKQKQMLLKKQASNIMKKAKSLDELFSEMGRVLTESGVIRRYNGKSVTKVELQLEGSMPDIRKYNNDEYWLSVRYKICVSSEYSGFASNEIERLFDGFDSGSGGFHSTVWVDSKGKTWSRGSVNKYDCKIKMSAIPNISKQYERYAKLSEARETWEEDKKFVVGLTPNKHQEKIDSLKKEWESIKEEIDQLLEKQRALSGAIHSYNEEHIKFLESVLNGLKEQDPFPHEKEYQDLKKIPNIDQISKILRKNK